MQDTISRLYAAILRLYRFDRAIAVFASTVSRLFVLRAVPPPLALAVLKLFFFKQKTAYEITV